MKKVHKWILGIGISLILLSGASVAVFYIGTNMVLTSLMPELPELEERTRDSSAEIPVNPPEPSTSESPSEQVEKPADPKAQNPEPAHKQEDVGQAPPQQGAEQESKSEREEAPTEPPHVEAEEDTFAYSAEITEEKQQAVVENISFKERVKLTTTLMSNLSSSEIRQFMNLAQGGLSIEEKREAKKIMLEKLSEDEYNELIAIAAKYGLSQGKGYAE